MLLKKALPDSPSESSLSKWPTAVDDGGVKVRENRLNIQSFVSTPTRKTLSLLPLRALFSVEDPFLELRVKHQVREFCSSWLTISPRSAETFSLKSVSEF